jgi:hypothetical protein
VGEETNRGEEGAFSFDLRYRARGTVVQHDWEVVTQVEAAKPRSDGEAALRERDDMGISGVWLFAGD